eukprot:CAMPEP_0113952786 /NCGR_PEP_ID=MMETSP1339-20121228/90602_1 /TAXON_ID=94617 /ORGANISM="Fibrocapsa japonica" /LENGTH=539 /DNA_ID=CAMNT_0000961451 /DNA_START=238 /DNA_END=1857 /DNA_ORIENTATION=+ /assembly_acc=CAM_ASM_000762
MARVFRKEVASLILLLLCCSMKHPLSAFMIQGRKATSASKIVPRATRIAGDPATNKVEGDVKNEILDPLNKLLKEGSLTTGEINSMITASDNLLEHLDELESNSNSKQYDDLKLRTAVSEMDVDAVSDMLEAGLEMDEATTDAAFWEVVKAVDRSEAEDMPLSGNVAQMIHHVFDADMRLLLQREKITTNVTCMQPSEETKDLAGTARRMNYVFDDGDHKNLPLSEGRRCEDGNCCDKCSRNIFPTFALENECNLNTFPELTCLTFNDLEKVSSGTILQFVRLVERVRRTIAHEYGLPLSTVLPLQAYSRKYVAGSTQSGGGGGEGDFVTLHTDEATHSGYHYSCVLYLSTQGEDFEGGNFVFNDPAEKNEEPEKANLKDSDNAVDNDDAINALLEAYKKGDLPDELSGENLFAGIDTEDENSESLEEQVRRAGRKLTPFHPTRGAAVIFSSGWENMHEVDKITSGIRYAVPCFFTTCPVPEIAYEQMKVGKPKTDEDIADDWLHLLLAHRKEEPIESVGRVKELLMKWHYLCTPLSEH